MNSDSACKQNFVYNSSRLVRFFFFQDFSPLDLIQSWMSGAMRSPFSPPNMSYLVVSTAKWNKSCFWKFLCEISLHFNDFLLKSTTIPRKCTYEKSSFIPKSNVRWTCLKIQLVVTIHSLRTTHDRPLWNTEMTFNSEYGHGGKYWNSSHISLFLSFIHFLKLDPFLSSTRAVGRCNLWW